jgi:precorrin-2 dehydrogenase/sirohydrochlorin ferrochelatase
MGRTEHLINTPPAACIVPIALDVASLPIAVVGAGDAALRRVAALHAAGARRMTYFCTELPPCPAPQIGGDVEHRLPSPEELERLRVIWIVGLEDAEAGRLAQQARAAGVLVNVEDRRRFCDFHNMAEMRRGDLLITVSTGGASPRLAGRIRAWLGETFGPEWAGRVAAISAARTEWRRETSDLAELSRRTDALLDSQGWAP